MPRRPLLLTCGPGLLAFGCSGPGTSAVDSSSTATTEASSPTEVSDSSSTTSASTSTGPAADSSSTTGAGSTSGTSADSSTGVPHECEVDRDCTNPRAPLCGAGDCVACTELDDPNAGCAALDPTNPACIAGTCAPCTDHAQCPGTACNLEIGACMTDADIVTVGPGGDFTGLITALESLGPDPEAVVFVDGLVGVIGSVTLGGTVAIIATSTPRPRWTTGGGPGPQLTVSGLVFVDGVDFGPNVDDAIRVQDRLWLDRSRLEGQLGIYGNVHLRNTMMSTPNGVFGMLFWDDSDSSVLDSTIVGTQPIFCIAGAELAIRNALISSVSGGLDVDGCGGTITTSALGTGDAGPGNAIVGIVDPAWFVDLDAADLHLTASAPAEISTTGRWLAGDPIGDLDLDLRPTRDDAVDFVGADVP